jgi:extracellular factor (EF) 3-hydroxypalmitic acid methyl ester biosynthesis protein
MKPPFFTRNINNSKPALPSLLQTKKRINVIEDFDSFIKGKEFRDSAAFCNFLNEFRLEIERREQLSSRKEILLTITKIRTACRESPFVERAQTWPRGYSGDFETINYIMRSENKAKPYTFGYFVEDYFLKSDICQQHKNKIAYQAQLIKNTINTKSNAKIISIGCGTSEDIKYCLPEIKSSQAEITLVDVDENAIDFSFYQLAEIKEQITALHGNIYKLMRMLTEKYDLILIGGVFDYLNDKTIISILQSLRDNLAENGRLFFTNIDRGNPYRIFMEYFSDWILTERSESNLISLINDANWPKDSYQITKDRTGLTHLVELYYCKEMPYTNGNHL